MKRDPRIRGTREEYTRYLRSLIEMMTYFDAETGCRIWCGDTDRKGYGRIHVYLHHIRVHRLAYALEKGPIPKGKFVLHHCDNPPCCNVEHLYIGSNRDNMRDRSKRGERKSLANALLKTLLKG
jgi:hypothetical protein